MKRSVENKDNNFSGAINHVEKADMGDPLQIGASIPGKVFKLIVKQWVAVKKKHPLRLIEAMKMETNKVAKTDGVIKSINVADGDLVVDKQLLMIMKEAE